MFSVVYSVHLYSNILNESHGYTELRSYTVIPSCKQEKMKLKLITLQVV